METIVNVTSNYEISIANQECLAELARFVVTENYKHHATGLVKEKESEIINIYNEEKALYSDSSYIYIARSNQKMIGTIRVFKWDKKRKLPIEKLYGINPMEAISQENHAEYWHVGRFAIDSSAGISSVHLFKQLMLYAISPIMNCANGYMIAEVDAKLLRVMNALGIHTNNLGESIYYLSSETIPIWASQRGIAAFYQHYQRIYKSA